jgi:hypothetical protein
MGEEEVGETTAGDGEGVCEEDRHMSGVHEEAHEDEVAEQRDEAVGEVEAKELCECLAGAAL